MHLASLGCTRSIPASAGEPISSSAANFLSAVYPRECGGTFGGAGSKQVHLGLSPRVRGNLAMHLASLGCTRSIPASAGEPLLVL